MAAMEPEARLIKNCGSGFSRDVSRTGLQLASLFSGMARFAALYFRKKRSHPRPSRRPQRLGIGVCARASCVALRRRTPKQAENDLSEPGMASEVKREHIPGSGPV